MSTPSSASPARPLSRGVPDRGAGDGRDAFSTIDLDRMTLLSGVFGLVALIPVLPVGLRAVLLAVFMLVCPGTLLMGALPRLNRLTTSVAAPAAGMAMMSLVLAAELAAGQFHPDLTTALVSMAAIATAVASSQLALVPGGHPTWPRPPLPQIGRDALVSLGLSAAGLVLWAWSIHLVRSATFTSYGLLFRRPEVFVACLLGAMAFIVAVRAGSRAAAWAAVLSLVLILRGYSLFATQQAMSYYTYTHLGVIDWFNHSGHLAVGVDVYSSWPGAFALGAWFNTSSGLSTLAMAHGFTLFYHLALTWAVYSLARSAKLAPMIALIATGIVESLNWVGQDYLSPQAFAYLLAVVVITLLFSANDPHYRLPAGILTVIIFTGVVWSHQLTPVWLAAIVCIGVVFKVVRPRLIALPVMISFAVMLAVNWSILVKNNPGVSADIAQNADGNITQIVSAGQAFSSQMTHVVAIALWISVLAVLVAQLYRRKRCAWLAAISFFASGFLLLTNYGGEAIFRVFLYSLLGAALILSPITFRILTYPIRRSWSSARHLVATAAALLIFAAAVQATFGGWFTSLISDSDVALQIRLERAAGPRGQIADVSPGFPSEMTWRYVPQHDAAIIIDQLYEISNAYTGTNGSSPTPVNDLAYAVRTRTPQTPTFVVVDAPIMRAQAAQFGFLKKGASSRIARHFRAAGWQAVYDSEGKLIFANSAGARAWVQQR